MKKILLPLIALFIFLFSCTTETTVGSEVDYRQQTMAGEYYPADKDSLANLIDMYADTTTMGTNGMSGYYLNYIVMPHGRMEYFMQNAKDPIRAITGYDFETFIFITDCNKHDQLETFDIYNGAGYSSSFGNIEIDTAIRNGIREEFPENCSVEFQNNQKYNRIEPYINVMAKLVPDKKIVPIVIGKADDYQLNDFAQKLDRVVKNSKKNVLAVVVTNMSENIKHDAARDKDVPIVQDLEMGNTFSLIRDDFSDYDNNLRALKFTTLLGGYGGANTFLPYLYNTSFNVYERPEEFNSVRAYLAALSYTDTHVAYVSFSPFKKMELLKELADSISSGFKLGLNGKETPNAMIVKREFQKNFPFFMLVKKDGKLLDVKGELDSEYNILFTAHKVANAISLNNPKADEWKKDYDNLYLGMYICDFPTVIRSFPKEGKFNKKGFGLISEKGETYVIPQVDYPNDAKPNEIKDILFKKAGISESDKHILYIFDIFVLEKNAPEE